jgi:hypothetical protein
LELYCDWKGNNKAGRQLMKWKAQNSQENTGLMILLCFRLRADQIVVYFAKNVPTFIMTVMDRMELFA